MNITESQLQLFSLAIIFYVVLTVGFNSFFPLLTVEAKKYNSQPIMSLEFVRSAKDVEKITGGNPAARQGLKTFLLFDTFAFIPLYLAFLFLMSFFLSHSGFDWAKRAAAAAVILAVLTALADFTENYFSYKALELSSTDPRGIGWIVWTAHVKWIGIFAATAVLSLFFWRGGAWNYVTYLLAASSLGGLLCLFLYRAGILFILMIQLLVLLTVGIGFMFSVCRVNFLENR